MADIKLGEFIKQRNHLGANIEPDNFLMLMGLMLQHSGPSGLILKRQPGFVSLDMLQIPNRRYRVEDTAFIPQQPPTGTLETVEGILMGSRRWKPSYFIRLCNGLLAPADNYFHISGIAGSGNVRYTTPKVGVVIVGEEGFNGTVVAPKPQLESMQRTSLPNFFGEV